MLARIKNSGLLTGIAAITVLLLTVAFISQPQAMAQSSTPHPPTRLTATAGDRSVTLDWANPDDSSITSYEIRMRKGYSRWTRWTNIAESDASTTSHVVSGLSNNKRYRFRIRAVNESGEGKASAKVNSRPKASSVDATPTPTPSPSPTATATPELKSAVIPGSIQVTPMSGNPPTPTATLAPKASPTATMTATPTMIAISVTPTTTPTPSLQRANTDPGVMLSTKNVRVVEGKRATYTLRLSSRPTSDVSITITTTKAPWEPIYIVESPHIEGKPRGAPIVFTRDNWDTPQTLTVSSISYSQGAGAHEGTEITHTATGGGYDEVVIPKVKVTVIDSNQKIEITNPLGGTTYAMYEWESGVTMEITMHQKLTGTPYPTPTLNISYRGSATRGADYTAPSTVSCAQFCEFRIKLIDDETEESNETIIVSLTSTPGSWSLLEGWGTQTVTIKDND